MLDAAIDILEDVKNVLVQIMQNEDEGGDGFQGLEWANEVFDAHDHCEAAILHIKEAMELSLDR